jgi:NADH-quinone oxidoreductase subunit K
VIGATHFLVLSLILLCLGLMGMMMRRSFIAVLASMQLAVSAAVLNFAAYGFRLSDLQGQTLAVVVLAAGAVQTVLGLGLAVGFVRLKEASEDDAAGRPRS